MKCLSHVRTIEGPGGLNHPTHPGPASSQPELSQAEPLCDCSSYLIAYYDKTELSPVEFIRQPRIVSYDHRRKLPATDKNISLVSALTILG